MRILIEAHHPAHIHFWKFPVRRLIDLGHEVLLLGRDRDIMKQLLIAYDWIPSVIPSGEVSRNTFPLLEFINRQWFVARQIQRFKPHVVASLMGSYCQSARILRKRNLIFTDSEFQHFNHRIAHPFAHDIFTPKCFYKDLGKKQHRYNGIHELMFLRPNCFQPNVSVLNRYDSIKPGNYVLIRISSWNTFHDIGHSGIGSRLNDFVKSIASHFRILVSIEENQIPSSSDAISIQTAPEDFHDLLYYSAFVVTEGASTASEAGCLGVPTVFINNTEQRGYLQMLESRYGIVNCFEEGGEGLSYAGPRIRDLKPVDWSAREILRSEIHEDHPDGPEFVVQKLINPA